MSDEAKHLIDLFSFILNILSVTVAASVALFGIEKFKTEFTASRLQRAEDLRWRKAQAGKSLNDEMLDDHGAQAAMIMLDWPGRQVEIKPGVSFRIPKDKMLAALRKHDPNPNFYSSEQYVRDAFDNLFYHLGRLEHSIKSDLVEFSDIEYPIRYYIGKLAENRSIFEGYLEKYEFVHGLAFLERFETWNRSR